jgi:hypothetical protein
MRRLVVPLFLALLVLPDSAATQEEPLIVFDHYHTLAEIQTYLQGVSRRFPELVTLHGIGRSREDRPIWAVDVNNPETGPAREKPGFYVDGNIHGGEVLGGEGALAFLDRLLMEYGQNPEITELVDTRAFYVVPIVNPDGRAISVDTPENHRWNVRPVDEDGDGRVDEDPPEDLDGDGRILQMRVPDPEGGWVIDDADPRRMVRVREEAGGRSRFRVMEEGIDNDEDGRMNEDRIGGVDLNRNFPANWSATQRASGPFPLSEPETHALLAYITDRPNIAAVHTFHTSGGLILRFPTLADQDFEFPRADIEEYRGIAEDGVALTGYQNFAVEKKPIVDLMSPGHGVFNDWASKEFGVLAITTEMWAHAMGEGQATLFQWNDEVLGGRGFIDWYPFQHPRLGSVELGGWDRWSTSNPPEYLMAGELERNVDWVLTFAQKTPRVAILEATADGHPGEEVIHLRATVANVGWAATATRHAQETLHTAQPVRVSVELDNARLVGGEETIDLGVLSGTHGGAPHVRGVSWALEAMDATRPVNVTVVILSEKAGTARRTVTIQPRNSIPS